MTGVRLPTGDHAAAVVGALAGVVLTLLLLAAPAASAHPAAVAERHAEPGTPGQPPVPTHSPDEARNAADDVLARPEFQRPEPNVVDKARNWISEQIGRFLQNLTSGGGASFLGWGIMLLAIAAIVFLVARLGRTVQADHRQSAEVSVERTRSAQQWAAEAERLESEGEWKRALRARFRALVADLVEHGLVDDVPGRTAGEYRAEVSESLPQAADAFAGATYLFEDAWYGDEPTGEEENVRFRALAARVTHAASSRRAKAETVTTAEAVPA